MPQLEAGRVAGDLEEAIAGHSVLYLPTGGVDFAEVGDGDLADAALD